LAIGYLLAMEIVYTNSIYHPNDSSARHDLLDKSPDKSAFGVVSGATAIPRGVHLTSK